MVRTDRTTGRGTAFAASVGVFALAVATLAASAATAAGERRAAARETAPECFTKLRTLVGQLANLERLSDRMKRGDDYLYFDGKTFYPVDRSKWETLEKALFLVAVGDTQDFAKAEADLAKSSAKATAKLAITIESGHELVQAREKRCNDLKSGGGSTQGSDAAFLAGTYTTNFRGNVTHGQANISVSGDNVTLTNESGETASATYSSGTLTVTSGWPDTTPSHPLVAKVTEGGGGVRIDWPVLLDGKSGGYWTKE